MSSKIQNFDCKVGDVVVDCRDPKFPQGKITAVGLNNQNHYPSAVRILWADGKKEKLNATSLHIRILPPVSEVPKLAAFAKKHGLIAARNPGRGNWAYCLLDSAYEGVYVSIVEEQQAGLYFDKDEKGKLIIQRTKRAVLDTKTVIVAGTLQLTIKDFEELGEW